MKSLIVRLIKKAINYLKARSSVALPQTDAAVEQLAKEVCELGGFPYNDSFLHSVATMIMHADQHATKVQRGSFVIAIKRAIANQAAFNVIEDTKARQKAARPLHEAGKPL